MRCSLSRAPPGLTVNLNALPVLGFVPFDFQIYSTVADHYLYLPMLGVGIRKGAVYCAAVAPGRG